MVDTPVLETGACNGRVSSSLTSSTKDYIKIIINFFLKNLVYIKIILYICNVI